MDIRYITPEYAVSPQIEPTDMALLAEQGFTMVINNRPDDEVPPTHQSEAMRAAAEAAGLTYVENPVVNGAMTMDMVTTQGQSITDASGAVFAYCRSGTRSTIVWALSNAGAQPTDALLSAAADAGYDISGLRGQIESLAQGG
ncbi:TIGR01244 family sulfur transferase [Psychromarinibacter halotolerans]|uniref:TIGR01244 family sulfur transferase n=1 Tax=Psychromarinibacter halotolerans TaxID=1775175 RepID=A0ABV7GRV1_9RHOB|nr:TIGR01244 family sulfur transferase [Psychromarinibacter halotolerans]MAQ84189.1 TIGR01244 family phosphatase [Maritimibacter sp.]MDF0597320.1 TIGR01244 family sulfur transferase [Psychromarinibacter halotolerans]